MKKVYLLKLEGGGDIDEKFVDEDAWNWIISDDMGRPPFSVDSSWVDTTVPQSVIDATLKEWPDFDGEVWLTAGSWQNDRALHCPANADVDLSMLDLGALRESLAAQGFEYTGEVYEGCIY